jgi:RP/EB family microtubule-associated protein
MALIVKWVNDFLELELPIRKVDELCSAVHYAQFLEAIFPGKVALTKLNFNAKNEYDLINNWKVIQAVLTAQNVTKPVDVAKLVKGKTQDNLEFAQWFKTFFDSRYDGSPYPAREKRANIGKKGAVAAPKAAAAAAPAEKKGTGLKQPTPTPTKAAAPAATKAAPVAAKPVAAKPAAAPKVVPSAKPKIIASGTAVTPVRRATPPAEPVAELAEQQQEETQQPPQEGGDEKGINVEEYNATLRLLRDTIQGLEKERNFYFKRLHAVEVYCQQNQAEHPIAKRDILSILYEEDDGKDDESQQRRDSQGEQPPAQETPGQQPSEALFPDLEQSDNLLDAGAADGDLLTSF